MAEEIGTYVLALRREFRGLVPADWQTRVRELPGVSAGPAASFHLLQIEADTEALARIRAEFDGLLHIEAVEPRYPLG